MSISDISVYLEQQHNACSSTCVAFILLHYYYFHLFSLLLVR